MISFPKFLKTTSNFTWWAILISIHPRSTIITCLRRNSLLACSLTRSFHQFFNPTRLTSYSATLLDNVFTTHLPKDVYSGIILNYRSDHFPVFAYFHDEHMPPTGGKTVFKRSFNERNFNKSTELLSRKNWSTFPDEEDPNESYDFIHELTRRSLKPSLPSASRTEGRTVTDPKEIADSFCKYFSNLGPNLAKALPKVNYSFRSFLFDNSDTPIPLGPTDIDKLEDICSEFSFRKAPGYDNITAHVIKTSFHLISTPLGSTINLSLQKGIFPDKLKVAKVTPVYRREDTGPFANFFSTHFFKILCTTDLMSFLVRLISYTVVSLWNPRSCLLGPF